MSDYHGAQQAQLVVHVGQAIDRYRAGELDAFEVDRVLFQYSRAAKELWKFRNYLDVEVAAAMILEQPDHDWWERGAQASADEGRCRGIRECTIRCSKCDRLAAECRANSSGYERSSDSTIPGVGVHHR